MKLILAACLLGFALAAPFPEVPRDGLLPALSMIKGYLSTHYGYEQVKTYMQNLQSDDPIALGIKTLWKVLPEEKVRELIHDFFSEVPDIAIEPGFEYPTLEHLFGEVKSVLEAENGVQLFREYLEKLQPSNEMLKGIVESLLSLEDEDLGNLLHNILSGVHDVTFFGDEYDLQSDLEDVAEQLKAILITPAGIQKVRAQLNAIQSPNPTIILVKTVLSAMSDKSLIDLVKEVGKNIDDVAIATPEPDLLELARKGKDLLATDEGIKYLRDYLDNLQTNNFLIVRVKNFVKSKSDAELKETILGGWKEIFGGEYALFYP